MSKLDELRRTMGANVAESASKRDVSTPPTAPTLAGLATAKMAGVARSKGALDIAVDRIEADPDQPREEFDQEALSRLAESLKSQGQLQPIRVRWDEGRGAYVIILGERRWRAAKMAGLPTLACMVSEGSIDAGELLLLQLIENCIREDLQPIEQAQAYRTLIERMGWSGNRLAKELGIAQSSVVHALAQLGLPTKVQDLVEQGSLAPSTAYEISKAPDPEAQLEVAARVVAEGLTRSEAIEAVRQVSGRAKGKGTAKGKSKGSARLPAEMKYRGSNGVRVVAHTTAKHALGDVVAALREIADRLEAKTEAQEAA